MDLITRLKQSGDPSTPLSMQNLVAFSNLDPSNLKRLRPAWNAIPAERRAGILHAFSQLAEDSVELDFSPFLLMCLDDPAAEVRAAAVSGLWEEDENPDTLRRLLVLANDPSSEVRAAVMTVLTRFTYIFLSSDMPKGLHDQTFDALMRAANEQEPVEVRRRAIECLGYFRDSAPAQAEISKAYAHPDIHMRESALIAMGHSMDESWFPTIRRELKSTSPMLRCAAARAVGNFFEDGIALMPDLLPLVDDKDTEVWQAAVSALGEVGSLQALEILVELARSENQARAEAALAALEMRAIYDDDDHL